MVSILRVPLEFMSIEFANTFEGFPCSTNLIPERAGEIRPRETEIRYTCPASNPIEPSALKVNSWGFPVLFTSTGVLLKGIAAQV